jgi:YfiH family protein
MRRVLTHLGQERLSLYRPIQVHGSRILRIDETVDPESFQEEGDGLATASKGIVLAVASADCVPLILFDPQARAGAVVHAGWRGTLSLIAREAAEFLRKEWGSPSRDLLALIGPGILPCCYRVGPELVRAFRDSEIRWGGMVRTEGEESYLDLPGANRHLLEEAGLRPDRIFSSELCTRCRGDLFPSFRREGASAGRLLSFLGSRASP